MCSIKELFWEIHHFKSENAKVFVNVMNNNVASSEWAKKKANVLVHNCATEWELLVTIKRKDSSQKKEIKKNTSLSDVARSLLVRYAAAITVCNCVLWLSVPVLTSCWMSPSALHSFHLERENYKSKKINWQGRELLAQVILFCIFKFSKG